MGLFQDLLKSSCISTDEFFNSYWQKKVVYAPSQEHINSYFNIDDLMDIFHNIQLIPKFKYEIPAILAFKPIKSDSGADTSQQVECTDPYYLFASKHSIVINRADCISHALLNICNNFSESTGFPFVFVNIYLTPPNTCTVPPHTDDKEVFIWQITGSKKWQIDPLPPIYLPYKHEELGKESTKPIPVDKKQVLQYTLNKGDLLYLPRGLIHSANTNSLETESLHLTIAIQTSDWDYSRIIQGYIKDKLLQTPLSRQCLPISLLNTNTHENTGTYIECCSEILKILVNVINQDIYSGNLDLKLTNQLTNFHKYMHQVNDNRINYIHYKKLSKINNPNKVKWNKKVKLVHINIFTDTKHLIIDEIRSKLIDSVSISLPSSVPKLSISLEIDKLIRSITWDKNTMDQSYPFAYGIIFESKQNNQLAIRLTLECALAVLHITIISYITNEYVNICDIPFIYSYLAKLSFVYTMLRRELLI